MNRFGWFISSYLGGGFKHFYFHPDPWGDFLQFDLRIFFKWVGLTLDSGARSLPTRPHSDSSAPRVFTPILQ